MIEGLTLGAYACMPKDARNDEALERRWYKSLSEIEFVSGLEVPYRGSLHPGGYRRMCELLPAGWNLVVTLLPQTVAKTAERASYGLASDDRDGRRAAIDEVRAALTEIDAATQYLGREFVAAVHLNSAPSSRGDVSSSALSLAESLAELAEWNATGVALVVEHCDAPQPDQVAQKGYLDLDEESRAIRSQSHGLASTVGQSINWGRSVIEGRSVDAPVRQLAQLSSLGTLAGLCFSGASAVGGPLGGPWRDVHNPMVSSDASSLLTAGEIERCLVELGPAALNRLTFLGIKVADPLDSDDIDRRLEPLREATGVVVALVKSVAAVVT